MLDSFDPQFDSAHRRHPDPLPASGREEGISGKIVRPLAIALSLSIAISIAALLIVGQTIGLFFAGIVIATTLLPPLSLSSPRFADRLLMAAAVIDGVAVVWLVPVVLSGSSITTVQWLMCYLLLISWGIMLFGAAQLLSKLSNDPIPAAAVVVALAMAWLTCPIWLPAGAEKIVTFHPLFALNGVLKHLGMWTERPIAYRYLFALGQDVSYELPRSIWPCAGAHLLVGLSALGLGRIIGRK
jgi:hypothetical protein